LAEGGTKLLNTREEYAGLLRGSKIWGPIKEEKVKDEKGTKGARGGGFMEA